MSEVSRNVLEEFLNELKNIFRGHLKKAILYGSYARGDFKENSDIDIMILVDLPENEIEKYQMLIWEKAADIEIENGTIISPIVRNIDNFNSWSNVKPFYMNIMNEGVELVG